MTGNFLFPTATLLLLSATFRFQMAISVLPERDIEIADRNIAMGNRNFVPFEGKVPLFGNPACILRMK
jgi:hypothetical protein